MSQRLSAELLLGQLNASHSDADVRRVLLQAFDVVEKSFLESIDDALAERANLLSQLPEVRNPGWSPDMFPRMHPAGVNRTDRIVC
ncbi:TGF-beta-activated kinase 1 and MAP3K7-binding protein 1 isoform X1 [Acipenser oxyrinchus oxyrinchus]|uniref:TGF-beta-activated kinase 1 and MAP3K7-binding protein 1 isoform X1 n=1 Tax=Acipenser oxyrinchus oxyrinchus TaxID=40147 RepID=A0AAD8CQM4_ACIOX|nr:TGF-beta-activated kinase 1 and MAP3K7-binding protein 1 isoform X1 [Acipenser oxyrinchus oxyrinchus]